MCNQQHSLRRLAQTLLSCLLAFGLEKRGSLVGALVLTEEKLANNRDQMAASGVHQQAIWTLIKLTDSCYSQPIEINTTVMQ